MLQLGIENAVTLAVEPVALASTVFAACCASWPSATPFVATDTVTLPVAPLTAIPEPAMTESTIEVHADAVVGPVEMIACPEVEPAILVTESGVNVVANAAAENSAASAPIRIFFRFMAYLAELFNV